MSCNTGCYGARNGPVDSFHTTVAPANVFVGPDWRIAEAQCTLHIVPRVVQREDARVLLLYARSRLETLIVAKNNVEVAAIHCKTGGWKCQHNRRYMIELYQQVFTSAEQYQAHIDFLKYLLTVRGVWANVAELSRHFAQKPFLARPVRGPDDRNADGGLNGP